MPPVGFRKQVESSLPGTVPELVGRTGLAEGTVKKWLRVLRAEGQSHIGQWKRSRSSFQPVHVAGPGTDAVCRLKARGQSVYNRRYRERLASENGGEGLDRLRARARAMLRAKSAAAGKMTDPLLAALFAHKLPQPENP